MNVRNELATLMVVVIMFIKVKAYLTANTTFLNKNSNKLNLVIFLIPLKESNSSLVFLNVVSKDQTNSFCAVYRYRDDDQVLQPKFNFLLNQATVNKDCSVAVTGRVPSSANSSSALSSGSTFLQLSNDACSFDNIYDQFDYVASVDDSSKVNNTKPGGQGRTVKKGTTKVVVNGQSDEEYDDDDALIDKIELEEDAGKRARRALTTNSTVTPKTSTTTSKISTTTLKITTASPKKILPRTAAALNTSILIMATNLLMVKQHFPKTDFFSLGFAFLTALILFIKFKNISNTSFDVPIAFVPFEIGQRIAVYNQFLTIF
jgi:hypothetical protein